MITLNIYNIDTDALVDSLELETDMDVDAALDYCCSELRMDGDDIYHSLDYEADRMSFLDANQTWNRDLYWVGKIDKSGDETELDDIIFSYLTLEHAVSEDALVCNPRRFDLVDDYVMRHAQERLFDFIAQRP